MGPGSATLALFLVVLPLEPAVSLVLPTCKWGGNTCGAFF